MDWTFWLGLVGIVALWAIIRWGNASWRRHAARAHRERLGAVDATEVAGTDAEPQPEQRSSRAWFERPTD